MTENTQHWGPFVPPTPPTKTMQIDGWRIEPMRSGRGLLWIVAGYTHVIGTTN